MNIFNLVDRAGSKGRAPTPFDYWVTSIYLRIREVFKREKS